MELLQIKDLTKRFDGFTALHGVDLMVEQEELLGVIGPNGAGKTTLLNLIGGELSPTEGRIFFSHQRIDRLPPYRRARLGIGRTFQITSLFPALSVRKSIEAALRRGRLRHCSGKRLGERVEEVLKLVGLGKRGQDEARKLSHGEQRLLEIGLALSLEPMLLLLDEPTGGLSPPERKRLVELIHGLEGMSIILVEHDIKTVLELSQRIMVLHRGRVLAAGSPESISQDERVQEVYLGRADVEA